jgi:cytochrome c556
VKLRAHRTGAVASRVAFVRTPLAAAFLAASLVATGLAAVAQERSAATTDLIFARKTIMSSLCDKMMEIERMIAAGNIDAKTTRTHGRAMSVMLMAFPHLFPPSSNQWQRDVNPDPVAETLASPDLWTSFPDFYRQAAAAARAAAALSRADKAEDIKTYARELRIGCDTCHALYLEEP